MMQPLKRLIAALMALVLICTAVPFPAYAELIDTAPGYSFFGLIKPDEGQTIESLVDTYVFKNGETVVSTQSIKEGEETTVVAPASPEKTGYKFLGWKLEGTEDEYFAGAKAFEGGKTYTYTADFQEIYYVFFLDAAENGRVIATKEGASGEPITVKDVTFPVNADQAITGWYTESALTNRVESVTLNGANVTLYPKVETGYWITYNADGGSYTDPAFVTPNTKTEAPAEPTREGYTFLGWYNGNTKFTFGSKLTDNVTLTARWQGNANTKYTVIHWQENVDDNKFSFKESETMTGTTGDLTAAAAKSYDGFTDQDFEQKTIAGDGSTIVNVYYNRNIYEVKFYKYEGGLFWGSWNELTNLRITAKYGAYIGDKWPTYNGSSLWATTKSGGTYQANIDTMPLGGAKFYYSGSSGDENVVPYFVEALKQDGSEGTIASDGLYYVLHHNDTSKGTAEYGVTDEDRYPITGFTVNTTLSSKNEDSYGSAKFYYTRNSYEIKFINNGSINTVSKKYQEDISDVSYTPTRPEGIPADYKFMGWYDNELGEGEEYVFSGNMPAKNITVYAKWAPPTVSATAFLTIEGDRWAPIEVAYGSKINEDDLPEVAVPDGYTWRYWAVRSGTAPNYVYTPFNFNTEIRSDITLYPYYTSNQSFTITYDRTDGTGVVPVDTKAYADGSYADVMTASTLTAPEGKVFLGWGTKVSGGTIYQPGDKIAVHDANITLYAIWGDTPTGTTLTYHSNYPDGTTQTSYPVELANNSFVTLSSANTLGFSCDGYEFRGWSTTAGGSVNYTAGEKVLVDNKDTNDLYAVWQANKFDVTYTYTGTAPAGAPTLPKTTQETVKSTVQVADKPTMDGYTFDGWKLGDEVVTSFKMPAHDVELTGSWTIRSDLSYTVRYQWNGQDIDPKKNETFDGQTFGATVSATPISIDGYTPVSMEAETCKIGTGTNEIIINYYNNVTLQANSDTFTYDGTKKTVSGYTGAPDGVTFEGVTASRTETNADEYPVEFSKGAVGTVDTSKLYIITAANPGKLTITKTPAEQNITIIPNPQSKVYDAAALAAGAAKATANDGSAVTIEYRIGEGAWTTDPSTLTITNVSESTTVQIRASAKNYDGYATSSEALTITQRPVTFTGESATLDYTSKPIEITGISAGEGQLVTGHKLSGLSYSAKGTDAGNYDGAFSGTAKIMAGQTDVTGNYNIQTAIGKLTITKTPAEQNITIIPNPQSKVYDAAALAAGAAKATANDGSAVTIEYRIGEGAWTTDPSTLTITNVSESTTVQIRASAKNYDGYATSSEALTITQRPVTFAGESGTRTYTGSEIELTTVTVSTNGLVSGHTHNVACSANGKDADTYMGTITAKDAVKIMSGETDVTGNYDITMVAGTLTITKAQAKVVAQPASKEHGAEDPTFTAKVYRVVGETEIEGLYGTDTVTYTVSRTGAGEAAAELVGTYDDVIVPTGETPQGNYTVEYVPADFEILLREGETVPVTKTIGDQKLNLSETATFTITVTNIYNTTKKMTVTEQDGVTMTYKGTVVSGSVLEDDLAPGQVATITAQCVVDEAMIRNGYTNEVTVKLGDLEGEAEAVLPTAPVNAALEVTKTSEDKLYSLADTIAYTITVKNTGNVTLTDLQIVDELTGGVTEVTTVDGEQTSNSIAPNETRTYKATYTVTKDDVKANANGNVVKTDSGEYTLTNTVVATAKYTPTPAEAAAATDDKQADTASETIQAQASVTNRVVHQDLEIVKTVLNPQDVYDFGEVIEYQITVTNNGTYTEPAGLTITDQMNNATGNVTYYGDGWKNGVYTLPQLNPGDSVTVYCSYTVQESDFNRVLSNTAVVRRNGTPEDISTSEDSQVIHLYSLAILYLDADTGIPLEDTYLVRLKAGTPFYVKSPVIDGYTTDILAIKSGVDGMPAQDLVFKVLYTAVEEPEEEPEEPEVNVVTPTEDGGYDLTPIGELDTPLADMDLGDHTCCIMHFLLMLASLITLAFYTDSRKKHQARIHQLRQSLRAEGKDDPSEKM